MVLGTAKAAIPDQEAPDAQSRVPGKIEPIGRLPQVSWLPNDISVAARRIISAATAMSCYFPFVPMLRWPWNGVLDQFWAPYIIELLKNRRRLPWRAEATPPGQQKFLFLVATKIS